MPCYCWHCTVLVEDVVHALVYQIVLALKLFDVVVVIDDDDVGHKIYEILPLYDVVVDDNGVMVNDVDDALEDVVEYCSHSLDNSLIDAFVVDNRVADNCFDGKYADRVVVATCVGHWSILE